MFVYAASAKPEGKGTNEDAFAISDRVFAVTDGVGSVPNAHEASRTAADELVRQLSAISLPPPMAEFWMTFAEISRNVRTKTGSRAAGVAVWFPEIQGKELLFWGMSAGDVRAYRLRATGQLIQLTTDHVPVMLDEQGQILQHKLITASFGGNAPDLDQQPIFRSRLSPGECLLLMSDGAWRQLERSNEWFNLVRSLSARKDPQAALNELVAGAANESLDDATALIFIYR